MPDRSIIHDSVAGIAIAGLIIPEAIAYAGVAGLDPVRALFAAIAGGLCYALIGRSRFAIIAPTSSSAAILAAALASLPGDIATKGMMATVLIGMVGAIFAVMALFRLGSLSAFVSRPVLRGFALGLAITIIIRQLPKLLGFAASSNSILSVLTALSANIAQLNPVSSFLGLGALCTLLLLRRTPQIPGALVVLVAGIAMSLFLNLSSYGVALSGHVSLNLQLFEAPNISFALGARLLQLAAPIALILFAESWGTMRALALKHGDTLDANRELGALGFANVAAALVQGMPVGSGFSAGSACEAAGAQSRMAGATAAIAVCLLALFAGGGIALIPEPMLAAVVIAALSHALSPLPIVRLFRLDRDQWIAIAAAVGVISVGVLNGMLIAIALSIADLLRHFGNPTISELGQIGDSHDFVDRLRHSDANAVPGIVIYRPNAPLFFANAESVLNAIAASTRGSNASAVVVSLEESNDLDSSAVEALGEFSSSMAKSGKRVILARAHDNVRGVLQVAGSSDLAKNSTFSVADAVDRAIRGD